MFSVFVEIIFVKIENYADLHLLVSIILFVLRFNYSFYKKIFLLLILNIILNKKIKIFFKLKLIENLEICV